MQNKKKTRCLGYPIIIAVLLISLISSCSSGGHIKNDVFDGYSEMYDDIKKTYSLYIVNLSDIKLSESIPEKSIAFYSDGTYDTSDKDEFNFISEDESVVTVCYDEDSSLPGYVKITKVGAGETFIYIESKDGATKTDKIKVTVEDSATTVPTTVVATVTNHTTATPTTVAATTVAPTSSAPTTVKQNNYEEDDNDYNNNYDDNNNDDDNDNDYNSGGTVYITPSGEKYHLSSACAGKNAIPKDYNSVKDSYGPCKKCAQ